MEFKRQTHVKRPRMTMLAYFAEQGERLAYCDDPAGDRTCGFFQSWHRGNSEEIDNYAQWFVDTRFCEPPIYDRKGYEWK